MQINLLAVTVIESVIVKCLVAVALLWPVVVVFLPVCVYGGEWVVVSVLLPLTTFVCVNLKRTPLLRTTAKNGNLRPD